MPLGSDQTAGLDAECAIRELERDNFRVETIEVGYVTAGQIDEQGVIWLRILLRDLKNNGPTDSDVIINLGKVENFMLKRTFKFSQQDAFIGFHGKESGSSLMPIT